MQKYERIYILRGITMKMTVDFLMEKIDFPEEGRKTVDHFSLSKEEYIKWKDCFYRDTEEFFKKAETVPEKEKLILVLYLSFAADLYETFKEKGIKDQIYFDTFSDFKIWYVHCVKKTGRCGLDEKRWLALPLHMGIFRLGRLQYQPGELTEDQSDGERIWKKGEKVLHVHIPEGSPMTAELCDASLREAAEFFGPEYNLFDCDSWLLAPSLTELLSFDSNILKFQRRFHICEVTYGFRQAEERVFGEILEEKAQYPEHTSLQKKVKEYVLQGKNIGMGYGIFERKEI